MHEKVNVNVDGRRDIARDIPGIKTDNKDAKPLNIALKDYKILNAEEHTFINTLLQLSNLVLGLRQQYQQHMVAIKDITETIKDIQAGRIREIYRDKGGMFLIKQQVDKKVLLTNLRERRNEIINANNVTIGQIQKNHTLFLEYAKKSALKLAGYLKDNKAAMELVEMEKEFEEEAKNLLKGL